MEDVEMNASFWHGKQVFLTGHTGFKGGWLSLWLQSMGAQVHGYALPPPTEPNFFNTCGLNTAFASSTIADIRNFAALKAAMRSAKPEIVFHLAAQPLVRASYANPVETFAVNVMGTAHLLEAVRHVPGIQAVVIVTTDKCYKNNDGGRAYRENDPLGGYDPYASSKACAELVVQAYRGSFLQNSTPVATARAGNVIGGGDWATDRLIPDFLRALDAGAPLVVRSPEATRPWQHVLEPLSGYLLLAEKLSLGGDAYAEAWNFGPDYSDARSVQWIVEQLCAAIPGACWHNDPNPQPYETADLCLDSAKVKSQLGWTPRWSIAVALDKTLQWHRAWKIGADMRKISLAQIRDYATAESHA
jgi:CDP-glucose 4,6-dehydratase